MYLLKELGVATIKVIGSTDRSILLEDLEKRSKYRLGIKSDLSDIEVAKALAKWYVKLHSVCSSLSGKAQKAFMDEYGEFNETEKIIDDGISDLINLICAYKRHIFPKWAESSLNSIHNGALEQNIKKILELSC